MMRVRCPFCYYGSVLAVNPPWKYDGSYWCKSDKCGKRFGRNEGMDAALAYAEKKAEAGKQQDRGL